MKFLFVALACLSPLYSNAQMVINQPPSASGKGEMNFSSLETFSQSDTSIAGTLSSFASGDALIVCEKSQFHVKGAARFHNQVQAGYFHFESLDACLSIARSIASHPGMPVKFTVTIDPSRNEGLEGFVGGDITTVEWEKLAK